MAIDVQALVEDAKKKRATAQASAEQARKQASQNKSNTKAANQVIEEANVQFNYANSLEQTIIDLEGQIQAYVNRLSRGDKLSTIDQKDLNRLTKQYDNVTQAYQKAYSAGNKILAKVPKESKATIKASAKQQAPTSEAANADQKAAAEATATVQSINDGLDKDLKNARSFLAKQSEAQRQSIARTLTAAGFATPDTGKWNDTLVAQYTAAISAAKNYNNLNKDQIEAGLLSAFTFPQFLADRTAFRNIQTAGGTATGGTEISKTISDPTQAESIIQPVFDKMLGREATAKEVEALTKILNDAENKNPYKRVNGVTTGGLDKTQFLVNLIKTGTYTANPKAYPGILGGLAKEVKSVTEKAAATKAGREEGVAFDNKTKILQTARANGLNLSEDQINNYLEKVKAGKDVDIVLQSIRDIAALGMPDNVKKQLAEGTDLDIIYSPYRSRMASILEMPVNSIDLNDSALRSAIGPDKEMPLYEFEKALRKDSRWQYTNNARETVSDAALRVLKDFGFQG